MAFLIVVLFVVAVALALALNQLKARLRELEHLRGDVKSLERRLDRIEQTPQAAAAAPMAEEDVVRAKTRESYVAPVPPPPATEHKVDPAFPGFVRPYPQAPESEVVATTQSVVDEPVTMPVTPSYVFREEPEAASEPVAVKRSVSIEGRLGQNWLNKLGIVTLVLGVALFLGYQLRTLGPMGKSLIGLALSVALLGGGVLLERRETYRIFARAGIGGGWALTFFVTFALYHVDAMKVLQSQGLDLMLMFLVAAAMVWHSLKYKSQVVTSLAFLLAFVTVGISHVTLFSLVAGAVLAAALVVVAARECWFELGLAGLVGVYLNHYLWLSRVLPDGGQVGHPFPDFLPSAGLLLLYWLIFRAFYVLRLPANARQRTVASLTAILNSIGLMTLLKYQSAHPEWAFYSLLVLGAAEMVLAFFARRRWQTAFVVLSSIGSVLLLAAIPFRFSGANWSLLWLLQAEVLLLAGVRLREAIFRRLGVLASFAAAAQIFIDSAPVVDLRMQQADPSRHVSLTITLLCAALLFWWNAEFAVKRWPAVDASQMDGAAMMLMSYVAPIAAAYGFWICIPGAWTAVVWMALSLLLAWLAGRASSKDFATQAELLALAAIVRVCAVNFSLTEHVGGLSLRAVTIVLVVVMLYAGMWRKFASHILGAGKIAEAYSWPAAALVSVLCWYELRAIAVAGAWAYAAVLLFELGRRFKRRDFRQQSYVLFVASFVRIFFANIAVAGTARHGFNPRVFSVAPLIAAYFWIYERLYHDEAASAVDRFLCKAMAWLGTATIVVLLYNEVPWEWFPLTMAGMTAVLLVVGWRLKRTIFLEQTLTALAATLALGLYVLADNPNVQMHTFYHSRVFTISAMAALLLAALPVAFAVRRQHVGEKSDFWRGIFLFRPEQPFFFVPLLLITVLLAVELRAGMITIGWSALGVAAFLFALTVGERSYRLAGLGLLMLGVAKIIFIDIWHASPSDRYITLIVMGAALLLVSFLYSRYKETILKFL